MSKKSIYCDLCGSRPKEYLCGCGKQICNSCRETEHNQCNDNPADVLDEIKSMVKQQGEEIKQHLDNNLGPYQERNDNLLNQATEYFNKEGKIIDEYNAKRLKQLEADKAEQANEIKNLSDQLMNLELQYLDELKNIKEESNKNLSVPCDKCKNNDQLQAKIDVLEKEIDSLKENSQKEESQNQKKSQQKLPRVATLPKKDPKKTSV